MAAVVPPKYSDLPRLFGPIDLNAQHPWADEGKHMTLVSVPTTLIDKLGVTRIYCNKAMAPALNLAFDTIVARNLEYRVLGYGGCFVARVTRGRSTISTHAWGLAIDLNPEQNPLGDVGTPEAMHPDLVDCFTEQGFIWGGLFQRPDPMHLQWVLPG